MVSKLIIAALTAWVVNNTDLPAPAHPPIVTVAANQAEVCDAAYPEERFREAREQCYKAGDVLGVYDPDFGLITLLKFDRRNIIDQSILVHEITHHLQILAKREYGCRGALEKVAYDAQAEFLRQHGLSLYDELEIDAMFYTLITSCHDRRR